MYNSTYYQALQATTGSVQNVTINDQEKSFTNHLKIQIF